MALSYHNIFDIDGREFVTSQGIWRAIVRHYPSRDCSDDRLRLSIEFKHQSVGGKARKLDLWIVNAPDVTLVAESIGMLQAIQEWLDDSVGDDELLYDSEIKDLVPLQKGLQPRT